MTAEQERIDSLLEAAGRFLFFAHQGLITSGQFAPGEIIVGLAQVATLAKVSPEDWATMLAASNSMYEDSQEAKRALQQS